MLPKSVLVTKLLQSETRGNKTAAMLTDAHRKNKNLRKQLVTAKRSKDVAVAARKSAEEKNLFELQKTRKEKMWKSRAVEFAESFFDWSAILPFYRRSSRFRDAVYGGHKSADCFACTVHDRSKHHCVDAEFLLRRLN